MKKLHFLLLLFIITGSQTFAQRTMDFRVKLLAPTNKDTITTDEPFAIKARIYNLGPDTFFTTDSAQYALIFDGSPISFYTDSVTSFPYLELDGQEIDPRDSTNISFNFTVNQGWQTGLTDFCVSFKPFNATRPIVDNDTTNNTNCTKFQIIDAVGISGTAIAANSLAVYPNPAKDVVNFSLTTSMAAHVTIRLFDITGRTLLLRDEGLATNGNHSYPVNISALSSGMYLYKVIVGNEQLNGRIQVQ